MPDARRVLSATTVCVAVALSLGSPALAGTVDVEPGKGLVFRAAPGETNDVTVLDDRRVGNVLWRSIVDLGAPLVLGPDCVAGEPATCPSGPTSLFLGNRDDRATMRSQIVYAYIYGEGGDDTVHSDGETAYGYGGPGDDHVRVSAHVGYAYGGTGDDQLTGGAGIYNEVHGDGGDDLLVQGTIAYCAILFGDGGADTLLGHGSNCGVSKTTPLASGGSGPDALVVTSPPGGDESWRLDGGDGADYVVAGGGADVIAGGAGPDFIQAAADGRADTIACGSGRDVVRVDALDTVAADCEQVTVVG